MSFIIAVYVNEGIVLASDRRTTYSNTQTIDAQIIQNIGIHTTNSTDKTFMCPNGIGIATCGEGSLLGKPITGFIQEFIREKIKEDCCIETVPNIILEYFEQFNVNINTNFLVAGYMETESGKKQKIYRVLLKTKEVIPIDTISQGASWDGETSTLIRLLQPVAVKSSDGQYMDLPFEDILWGYFTLQDAVDFARYAVETTIQTMRFKNVIETVGGAVDILVITPDEARWLQKTNLK